MRTVRAEHPLCRRNYRVATAVIEEKVELTLHCLSVLIPGPAWTSTSDRLPGVARGRDLHRNTHIVVHTWGLAMETLTTRVFNNGNSQAVRIPAEFRLDTDRVSISRNESGDLVIHPLRAERGAALLNALRAVGEADPSFIAALEAERASPQPIQEREAL